MSLRLFAIERVGRWHLRGLVEPRCRIRRTFRLDWFTHSAPRRWRTRVEGWLGELHGIRFGGWLTGGYARFGDRIVALYLAWSEELIEVLSPVTA